MPDDAVIHHREVLLGLLLFHDGDANLPHLTDHPVGFIRVSKGDLFRICSNDGYLHPRLLAGFYQAQKTLHLFGVQPGRRDPDVFIGFDQIPLKLLRVISGVKDGIGRLLSFRSRTPEGKAQAFIGAKPLGIHPFKEADVGIDVVQNINRLLSRVVPVQSSRVLFQYSGGGYGGGEKQYVKPGKVKTLPRLLGGGHQDQGFLFGSYLQLLPDPVILGLFVVPVEQEYVLSGVFKLFKKKSGLFLHPGEDEGCPALGHALPGIPDDHLVSHRAFGDEIIGGIDVLPAFFRVHQPGKPGNKVVADSLFLRSLQGGVAVADRTHQHGHRPFHPVGSGEGGGNPVHMAGVYLLEKTGAGGRGSVVTFIQDHHAVGVKLGTKLSLVVHGADQGHIDDAGELFISGVENPHGAFSLLCLPCGSLIRGRFLLNVQEFIQLVHPLIRQTHGVYEDQGADFKPGDHVDADHRLSGGGGGA